MKVTKIRDVRLPERGTEGSAGIDFFIPNDYLDFLLSPGEQVLIPSGIIVKLPPNTAMVAFNKSGVATGTQCLVGACVVDNDYQGEVHIHLVNAGNSHITLTAGMKIVQFVVLSVISCKVKEVASFEDLYKSSTQRGSGGFGSTGS